MSILDIEFVEEDSALELRASSMPLAFLCPGSVRTPTLRVREESDAADLGTAVHEALRPLVELGSIDWDSLPALAARHCVDFAELRMLVAVGSQLWHQVKGSFPDALTEIEVCAVLHDGTTVPGHIDVLSLVETVGRFADWKTGRKDSDYAHQVRAYASGLFRDNRDLTEVTGTILWLRDNEIENYSFTRAEAEAWLVRVESEIVRWDGTFHPGTHCQFCPRSHECDAANAMVRRDVAALRNKGLAARAECELELMQPAEIVELYEKASLVENYAGRVRDAIKAHVTKAGDIKANGHRLTLEREQRRELDPVKAWPVLDAAGFTDEDFAAAMTLGISKVNKRVAEKAGRGKGAAAVRKVEEALDAAHAIGTREIVKLRLRRD